MGEGAAAQFGCASHQECVRRRADADHKHPRAATQRRDRIEQLLLIADSAVGQEDDLAQHAAVTVRVVCECSAHGRDHLGAAGCLEAADIRGGVVDVPAVSGNR